MEEEREGVGMGTLPLIESVGSSAPNFPDSEELADQLSRLMRQLNATNNVNTGRFRTLMQGDTFPQGTSGKLVFEWPEFRPAENFRESSRQPNTNAGVRYNEFSFYSMIYSDVLPE